MWIHLIASLYSLHFEAEIMNYMIREQLLKRTKLSAFLLNTGGKKKTSMRNSSLTHHFSRLLYVLKLCMNNPSQMNVTTPALNLRTCAAFSRFNAETQIF